MRTALFSLLAFATLALVPATQASQTVWKWVDGNGVTHYSDRSVPGATRMELNVGRSSSDDAPQAQTYPPVASQGPATSSATTSPSPATDIYRNFEIWSPADGETIPNTGGAVTVNVRVDPSLRSGDQLHLYMDGKLVEDFAPNTTSFDLTEVPRGLHYVVAIITDAGGRRVQQTSRVTFTVRQASIAQPPVGPTLRPPPKRAPGASSSGASNKLPATQPSHASLNGERSTIDPRTNAPVPKKSDAR